MSKPKFNPNQPFEVVADAKPKFDPSKPFEPVEEMEDDQGLLSKGLETAGRVLDYPGGLIRTGIAQVGEAFSPKSDIVTGEDWSKAFKGQAPTSSEYLGRAGVPEGPSADIPIIGDTSVRDVAGFGVDVATDPLGLIAKALRPAGKLLEGAGKTAYKSAFKKIDERTAEKGAKALSDVLLERGAPVGTTKSINEKLRGISDELLTKRSGLYDEGSKLGASVDVEKASQEALAEASRLRGVRGAEDLGAGLQEKVMSLYQKPTTELDPLTLMSKPEKLPNLTLAEASELKTRLNDILPEKAFDQFGRIKKDAQGITKKQAQGLRKQIIEEANKVRPGLGDEIDAINADLASILSSQQPLKTQIRRGETPNAVTSVDAMLGALTTPAALATKKAADLSKLTSVRTGVGKALMKAGQNKNLDPMLLRGLINASRPENE